MESTLFTPFYRTKKKIPLTRKKKESTLTYPFLRVRGRDKKGSFFFGKESKKGMVRGKKKSTQPLTRPPIPYSYSKGVRRSIPCIFLPLLSMVKKVRGGRGQGLEGVSLVTLFTLFTIFFLLFLPKLPVEKGMVKGQKKYPNPLLQRSIPSYPLTAFTIPLYP